ncbi:hypothetical protein [Pedobacter agri]|uniref:Uncharacterized protein n=1 Tax=Pedobacter agri TaxID=454586 RepID=A0A9X3IA33_9SPHI|nr:hypothetical protein [Pedobacter agri]MCX3266456.1 hypothetical protein [Pedobacter agri]
MKRNYFEKSFKEMMLSKIDNISNVDYTGEFYAIVLTRDSCCTQCGHYSENDIYAIDTILNDLPPLIRNCEHKHSCHASVSVMTENRYNASRNEDDSSCNRKTDIDTFPQELMKRVLVGNELTQFLL